MCREGTNLRCTLIKFYQILRVEFYWSLPQEGDTKLLSAVWSKATWLHLLCAGFKREYILTTSIELHVPPKLTLNPKSVDVRTEHLARFLLCKRALLYFWLPNMIFYLGSCSAYMFLWLLIILGTWKIYIPGRQKSIFLWWHGALYF